MGDTLDSRTPPAITDFLLDSSPRAAIENTESRSSTPTSAPTLLVPFPVPKIQP